jgi:chitin disaccharide deacetylase
LPALFAYILFSGFDLFHVLIINADDWGRSVAETDAALRCFRERRITSVSAMVFMQDSERAAKLAKDYELDDVGLHLNFSEEFTDKSCSATLEEDHGRIIRFLKRNKYAQLLYEPFLRKAFAYCYQAQAEEFVRLFGKQPSHIDGHHHMHLCANVLLSNMIPAGTRLRRNFSFWPGEKSMLNRAYRWLVDRWLARRYKLTDYFFDLTQCIEENKLGRVASLAKSSNVELMTHPIVNGEEEYLMSDEFRELLQRLEIGDYALV